MKKMKAAALVFAVLAQAVGALQGDSWRSPRLAFASPQAKGLLHKGRAFGIDGQKTLLCPASTAAAVTSLRRPSAARAGIGGTLKMQMDPLMSYSIYELDNWVTREVVGQLQHITPFSGVVLLVAGCSQKTQTIHHPGQKPQAPDHYKIAPKPSPAHTPCTAASSVNAASDSATQPSFSHPCPLNPKP
jgi:hypothetical protein